MDWRVILLASIAASPVMLPLIVRAIQVGGEKFQSPLAWVSAWASGICAPAFLGWSISRSEGGDGDSDPLVFFVMAIILAAAISIVTIMVAEARSVRE